MCIRFKIIGQNTQKCKGLVCQSECMHILVLKPWAKASRFDYHEPYQRRQKMNYKGSCQFKEGTKWHPDMKNLVFDFWGFFIIPWYNLILFMPKLLEFLFLISFIVQVLSRDSVTVSVEAVVYYRVSNPTMAVSITD